MDFVSLLAAADGPVREILGGAVRYTPTVGVAVDVEGIFTPAYVCVDAGTAGMSSASPTLFLRLSELPSDPSTDLTATVTIASVVYSFHEVQPDGLGGVTLLMHKV